MRKNGLKVLLVLDQADCLCLISPSLACHHTMCLSDTWRLRQCVAVFYFTQSNALVRIMNCFVCALVRSVTLRGLCVVRIDFCALAFLIASHVLISCNLFGVGSLDHNACRLQQTEKAAFLLLCGRLRIGFAC